MKVKKVFRLCLPEKKIRLFRVLWKNEKAGKVGTKNGGYSSKFSLALRPVFSGGTQGFGKVIV